MICFKWCGRTQNTPQQTLERLLAELQSSLPAYVSMKFLAVFRIKDNLNNLEIIHSISNTNNASGLSRSNGSTFLWSLFHRSQSSHSQQAASSSPLSQGGNGPNRIRKGVNSTNMSFSPTHDQAHSTKSSLTFGLFSGFGRSKVKCEKEKKKKKKKKN